MLASYLEYLLLHATILTDLRQKLPILKHVVLRESIKEQAGLIGSTPFCKLLEGQQTFM